MANMQKQVFIVDRDSYGNNFGDRVFTVIVELRDKTHTVLETKTFRETAQEGEHSEVRRSMTAEIKEWAKENGATFTGQV